MKFEQNNGLNKVGYVEELYFNIPYILLFTFFTIRQSL